MLPRMAEHLSIAFCQAWYGTINEADCPVLAAGIETATGKCPNLEISTTLLLLQKFCYVSACGDAKVSWLRLC